MPLYNYRKLNGRSFFGEKLFARPFVMFTLALILGIIASETGKNLIYTGILFLTALIIPVLFAKRKTTLRGVYLIYICVMPVLFLIGFYRSGETSCQSELKTCLQKSSRAVAYGEVKSISTSPDSFNLTLKDVTVTLLSDDPSENGTKLSAYGITVRSASYNSFPPLEDIPGVGAFIRAEGYLYPCLEPTNPGQFDESGYYALRGVDARMYADELQLNGGKNSLFTMLLTLLYKIRYKMISNLLKTFDRQEAGILSAMLTGERSLMDEDTKKLFKEGSISHVLSISGLHISLLGIGLFKLLLRNTKKINKSIYITIIFMLLYGLLTGFSVSTGRAVLMLCISLLAKRTGKIYDQLNALALSAFILLLTDPRNLYDTGFILSFTAVGGISLGCEVLEATGIRKYSNSSIKVSFLEHIKRKYTEKICLAGILSLFLTPALLAFYYEINIYTLAVNLIILPLMSIVLASGFLSMLFTVPFISGFMGGAAFYILKFYEQTCSFISSLPGSAIRLGFPGNTRITVYYCILIGISVIIICTKRKTPALIWVLLAFIFISRQRPVFSVDFLDVGQGDCIIMDIEGEYIMTDGGSSSVSSVGKYRIIPYLKYKGIEKIDKVFVTHTDSDHINGILELIDEGYPKIGTLIVSCLVPYDNELIQKALSAGITVRFAKAGTTLHDRIKILGPYPSFPYPDINSASLILSVAVEDFSMLLSGDVDFIGEIPFLKSLNEETALNGSYDVLKVAHHGSGSSTSQDFLRAVRPKLSIISCARHNYYGHPSKATLSRLREQGSEILVTKEVGRIGISLTKNNLMSIITGP